MNTVQMPQNLKLLCIPECFPDLGSDGSRWCFPCGLAVDNTFIQRNDLDHNGLLQAKQAHQLHHVLGHRATPYNLMEQVTEEGGVKRFVAWCDCA